MSQIQQQIEARAIAAFSRTPVPAGASRMQYSEVILDGDTLHAFDDCRSGHKGRWMRWSEQVGISYKGRPATMACVELIKELIGEVGVPVAHVATNPPRRVVRSSQVRYSCPECKGYVHMPIKQSDNNFRIGCIDCKTEMSFKEFS